MFDSRFGNGKVADEPVYKSELSINGQDLIGTIKLYSAEVSTPLVNSVVETNLIDNVDGSVVIPANTLNVGDVIVTKAWGGIVKTSPATPQTITWRFGVGGYIGASLVVTYVPTTSPIGFKYTIEAVYKMREFLGNPAPFLQYIQYLDTENRQVIIPTGLVVNPIFYDNTIDNNLTLTGQLSVANSGFSLGASAYADLIKV